MLLNIQMCFAVVWRMFTSVETNDYYYLFSTCAVRSHEAKCIIFWRNIRLVSCLQIDHKTTTATIINWVSITNRKWQVPKYTHLYKNECSCLLCLIVTVETIMLWLAILIWYRNLRIRHFIHENMCSYNKQKKNSFDSIWENCNRLFYDM